MIAKSDDMVVTHKMKWGNTDLISTQCLVHNAVAAYLHHIILYVNTGQMFWGVCIRMSRMCVTYICLVFNCLVCFAVYCVKSVQENIEESNSSLSKCKKETCFGNLKWITFSVE